MKLIKTFCPICHKEDNYIVLYPSNFTDEDFNLKIFSARRMPDRIHYQMVKCNSCGLVRSNPIADQEGLSKLYQKAHFTYDDEVQNLIITYVNALKPILEKVDKNANILEIGCGNGFVLERLFDMGYKNVFGVEPTVEAVKKARPEIKKNISCDILKPGLFKEKTFDVIFFFQTLDHIPEPDVFLQECCKLLKPGGYILAFNHDIDSFSSKILKEKSPIIDIEHTHLYSPRTIKTLFKTYGFKPISVTRPANIVSLRHVFHLFPLPKSIKKMLLETKNPTFNNFLKVTGTIPLGNLCIIATKA